MTQVRGSADRGRRGEENGKGIILLSAIDITAGGRNQSSAEERDGARNVLLGGAGGSQHATLAADPAPTAGVAPGPTAG